MKAKATVLALAVAGVFAAAASFAYGPADGYGPGMGYGMGFGPGAGASLDPAAHAERVQARLDGLKEALKLQPKQVDAWNAYAARVAAEAQVHAQFRQQMFAQRGDAEAMADQRVAMMKRSAEAADEINRLRTALAATLSSEQKATFDRFAMGPRFAAGPAAGGGPGYGPEHGPGFGPGHGRGFRGLGYGRGCLGMS